jgi:hypothetical protein
MGTTSDIRTFSPVSEPQPLAVKTSTEALWIYLQNLIFLRPELASFLLLRGKEEGRRE